MTYSSEQILASFRRAALIVKIQAATEMVKTAIWEIRAAKANFNPSQPRVPRGYRHGGRWTDEGDDWGDPLAGRPSESGTAFVLASHEDEPPRMPEKRPVSARERNTFARRVARYLRELPTVRVMEVLANAG